MTTEDIGENPDAANGRFKPGQSGNRKGRPKKGGSVDSEITSALNEKVTVTENGKSRKMTKARLTATRLVNKGAAGDPRSAKMVFDLAQKAEERRSRSPSQPKQLSESDGEIADRVIARLRKIFMEEINARELAATVTD